MIVVLILAFIVAFEIWHWRRCLRLLEAWAARGGYVVVSKRYSFWGGPFWWRKTRNARVFHVLVRDSNGRTRSGHVCCRPYLTLASPVDVIWDDRVPGNVS
jgi:hypothetical protein